MALFTGRGGDAGLSRKRFAEYQRDLDRRRLRSAGTDYINETTQEPYVGLQNPMGSIAQQRVITPAPPAAGVEKPVAPPPVNPTVASMALEDDPALNRKPTPVTKFSNPTPANPDWNKVLNAVMMVESGGNHMAVSPKGARGRYQVMPNTAKKPGFGVAPAKNNSAAELDRVGSQYLQALVKHYGGLDDALVAYNWGPGNADKWIKNGRSKNALPTETKNYLTRVHGRLGGAAFRSTSTGAGVPPRSASIMEDDPSLAVRTGTSPIVPKGAGVTSKVAAKEVKKEIAGIAKNATSAVKKVLTQKNPKEPPQYVNVQLINDELNAMRASREQLLAVANTYRRAGMGVHFIEAYGALNNMTAAMVSLSQQKAINMFETNGDPRMLQQMWSQESGSQIVIIPRSDGKWDVERDGQPWKTGVTTAAITNPARVAASQKYAEGVRAGAVAAQSKRQEFIYKAQIEALKKRYDLANTAMKAKMEAKYKMVPAGDGVGMWAVVDGNRVYMAPGEVEGPDGETVPGVKTTRGPSVGGGSGSMSSIVETAKGLYN